jgi:hypothetical protein
LGLPANARTKYVSPFYSWIGSVDLLNDQTNPIQSWIGSVASINYQINPIQWWVSSFV